MLNGYLAMVSFYSHISRIGYLLSQHEPFCASGSWNKMGLIKDKDVMAVAVFADVDGDEKEFDDGWDAILK